MSKLLEVDEIEIKALMDNVSDPFTKSHENMRWNELQYQFSVRKRRELCGADLCRACTGLSFFITLTKNNKRYSILFDTGPDDGLVVENAKRLGIDLNELDAIVLSHGHFDHFGGLISVLKSIKKKNIPVYIHPDLFAPRAFNLKNGEKIFDTYILTKESVIAEGGKIIESREPVVGPDNLFLLSGEVPRNTAYENGFPNEVRMMDGEWEDGSLVIDERIMMIQLKNKGLCIFTGCGHTGVVNACMHAKELSNEKNIYFLMGGFHLAGPDFENRIEPTVKDLEKLNPNYVITGHCTGVKAQNALTNVFKDRHIPYGVATVFQFKGE